jgi:hypothetical protein
MNQEQASKIERSIDNLVNKNNRIYFLVQDTKGNAKASIAYIYRMALMLKNNGFNPIMLHEKNDYTNVTSWLGEEFEILPHYSIENQNLEVAPEDFIVVPELYGFVMEQITKLSCGKVVLCQAYDHMLETLQPGQSWTQLGFYKCITTSEQHKEFISNVMRGVSFDIIEPHSMGLLLQSMQNAAIKAGYLSYLNDTPYVLRMDIQGYDELGVISRSIKPKFFTLKIVSMKFYITIGWSMLLCARDNLRG